MPKLPPNIYLRGKTYWYRLQHGKKEHRGSLETSNLGEAKERVERVRKELNATEWGAKPRQSFNAAAEKFGEDHFPNLKPASATRYLISIANLLETFNGIMLHDIGSAKIGEFERARRKAGVSSSTIRRDLACLSVIFTKAEEWEWATYNPVKPFLRGRQLAGLREGHARTRYLTIEEEMEILAHAPPKAAQAIAFAIDTGLRKEEQFGLLKTDVSIARREVRVRWEVEKTRKQREVPLWARALEIAKDLRADLRSPYLFTTADGARYSANSHTNYSALQKAVLRANRARRAANREPMAHVEWHDLRRTCGCRLLQEHKFSMEYVSKWLGHSSIKVTEKHYAFLDVQHLHEAVERSESKVVQIHSTGTKEGT